MPFPATGVRIALYVALLIFSICQLGMTAARLHYTTHVPLGDPVNGGVNFYDPIIVELLVSSVLSILWAPLLIARLHKPRESKFISTFGGEFIGLFVLFMLWIVGAAMTTHQWGNLAWCRIYQPCRLLTAIMAFSWMCWIMVLFAIAINLKHIIVNKAFNEPFYMYYQSRYPDEPQHMRQSQV